MSHSVELRAERRLWRAMSWAASGQAPRAARQGSSPFPRQRRIAIIAVAGAAELLLLIFLLAFGTSFLLVIGVVLLFAVVVLIVHVIGSLWWISGAGRPVLVLDGNTVHGRIRAATRDSARDRTWWDLAVPATRLAGVRLERVAEPAQRWTIVLDLPGDVRDELLQRHDCSWNAHRRSEAYGSPAAWQAGRMLRRSGRQDRVRALVAAIDDARSSRNSEDY